MLSVLEEENPSLKKQPKDPLQQLSDSAAHIAAIMDTLFEPLQLYLHDRLAVNQSHFTSGALLDELLRESPIYPLLGDDTINDILINGPFEVYITRHDKLEKTDIAFRDSRSLMVLATAIAASVGRTIDPNRPLVDARLKDGSRVNIIAPPMAVGGITVSIRKFPHQEITIEKLIENGEMTEQVAEFLKLCVESRVSILISGGTGTGKTTLLNAISHFVPETERIITIEDTAELRLQQPHVVRLETKEPHTLGERKEEVNAADLVRNALRMRPDRIIVGEVRGGEAYDMIQALNTGHAGSMTTVHANTPRDAFTRLENLIGSRMPNTPANNVRQQMVSALNIIIELVYESSGKRRISSIMEVVGMEMDTPTMQEIFTLPQGSKQTWTSIVPHHQKLAEAVRSSPYFQKALNAMEKTIS